jgi:hypothetical protein
MIGMYHPTLNLTETFNVILDRASVEGWLEGFYTHHALALTKSVWLVPGTF